MHRRLTTLLYMLLVFAAGVLIRRHFAPALRHQYGQRQHGERAAEYDRVP